MKILKFFAVAAFLCTTTAQSQITKGNWLVGGDGTIYYSKASNKEGDKLAASSGFNVNPNIGYFFYDQFAAGLLLRSGANNPEGENPSSLSYGVEPFVRYYLLPPEKQINVFLGGSFGYSWSKLKGESANHFQIYNFEAGPAIFFNSSVALEITANYEVARLPSYVSNRVYIALGFQIHLEK